MSGEAKWTYGEERDFVDPQTGEVIKERPVLFEGMGKRRKVRANAMGFVVLNMDAAVTAGRFLGGPGMLILMEAARQWRMGNGAVSLTTAFCERLGVTPRGARTAVVELEGMEAETGWLKVMRAGNKAVAVVLTAEGLTRIWHRGGSEEAL